MNINHKFEKIKHSINSMTHEQLCDIGEIIYKDNPENFKYETNEGTNILLNKLSKTTIDNIVFYIENDM